MSGSSDGLKSVHLKEIRGTPGDRVHQPKLESPGARMLHESTDEECDST
jgi:hypothetical protein